MQRWKYPRTLHLPHSSVDPKSDDKKLDDDLAFHGRYVIVTAKMDGENTTIYSDGFIHARSINSKSHVSRDWVKNFAAQLELVDGDRICGENLFAQHTLAYENLRSYFYGFGLWRGDECASWQSTSLFMDRVGIETVPIIFSGLYDVDTVMNAYNNWKKVSKDPVEGFVVRKGHSFLMDDFNINVAKYIDPQFKIKDTKHWFSKSLVKNKLRKD